jgi:hypothetical protein
MFLKANCLCISKDIVYSSNICASSFEIGVLFADYFPFRFKTIIKLKRTNPFPLPRDEFNELKSSFIFEIYKNEKQYVIYKTEIQFWH